MCYPDGAIAQRLAQGQQGGSLEGPQGPLAVDPADELGPTWSKARIDVVRQLTGSAGIEPSERGEGREQGCMRLALKGEPHQQLHERSDGFCCKNQKVRFLTAVTL
jgi:hypothetical protein